MSVVVRLFALALIAMLLFSGCAGNEAKKEPSTSTIASTTTKITTTTTTKPSTTTSKASTTTTTSTTSTTSTTTSTLADPYRPNPEAVLLSNLTNTGFAASYDNYSFSIGKLIMGSDNSIVGALLHVKRPDGTYIDLSVIKDSSDSALDKVIIRFAPAYAKDVSGIQTAGIYIWEENTSSGAVPNESATTSTGWIKIQSALNITYIEDGSFGAIFINDAGADVKIDDVLLNETDLDLKCKNILVDGLQASMAIPVTVKNNQTFNISADCPPKDYDTGYFLDFSISYKAVSGNEVIKHKETGRMTGGVKAYNEHYTP